MTERRCFELYRIIGGKPFLATMKFVQPFLDIVTDAALTGEIGKLVVLRQTTTHVWAGWHINDEEAYQIQQTFFTYLKWTQPLAINFPEQFDDTWGQVTAEVYSGDDSDYGEPSYRYHSPLRHLVCAIRHGLDDLANGDDSNILKFKERTGSDLEIETVKALLNEATKAAAK